MLFRDRNGKRGAVERVVLGVMPVGHHAEMRAMLGNLPAIGILYLSAALERAGYETVTLDHQHEELDVDHLAGEILAYRPSVVGFSLFDTTVESSRQVIAALRPVFEGPIVVGGYTATFHAEEILRRWPEVDYVVLREGEEPLLRLIEFFEGGREIETVPNLAHRANGGVQFTREAHLAEVTELAPPVRDSPRQQDATPIITRRGCLSRCSFCAMVPFYDTRLGPAVRHRRPADVVDEIAACLDRGSDVFTVYDDNFGLSTKQERNWAANFVREIERRDVRASLLVEMRVGDVVRGQKLLPDLCAAGIRHISLGMESLLERQLILYNKGYTVADAFHAVEILRAQPAALQTNIIFWDPFLTLDEALDHLDLLDRIDFCEYAGAPNFPCYQGVLTPHRGTRIYQQLNEAGMLRQDARAFYKYHYDFTDHGVREFLATIYPRFLEHVAVPRLPAIWLNSPRLEARGRPAEAEALRSYGRALARAEFDYFRAVIEMANRIVEPALQVQYFEEIAATQGELFRERAADFPAGVSALITRDRTHFGLF